jgi:AmpD protein
VNIDKRTGLCNSARQVTSANFSHRPDAGIIDLVVVHGISLPPGRFGGPYIEDLFTNKLDLSADPSFASLDGVRVSAHFLVRRDGELVQFVPVTRRAWHAGHSEFRGRPDCNDYSIGIELEGTDQLPYEDVQYQVLADLIKGIIGTYPAVTRDRIVGHSDIAPGRKTDPGPAFDWELLWRRLDAN